MAALLALSLAGLASAAEGQHVAQAAEPPALTTAYVEQLRAVSAQAAAARRAVESLAVVTLATKSAAVSAGAQLAAAAGSARDMLRTYRDARTRYGTPEEWRLAQQLLVDLQAARITYGARAGVTLPAPTAAQQSQAREMFTGVLQGIAYQQITRWTSDEALADALTSSGLKSVTTQLRDALVRRMEAQATKAVANATGLAVSLNVPLKQQVIFQAQRLAATWLARAVLHVSPQGLVIQLAGAPVVRWIGAQLQAMLRQSGNAAGRAERTMAQLSEWRRQLLVLSPTSSLAAARSLAARVDRELSRTGFLKLDLRRGGRADLLGRLQQSESLTRTALGIFRQRFLLDSAMAQADLNAMVDQAKRLLREIEAITKKLGATPTRSILGDWEAGGGVLRVTGSGGSYVGTLVKSYTFCRSGSVPVGQVEWRFTQTAANKYVGTVRFYKVSDCTYIGDAQNATWDYRPADDTVRACSYSPNPALPGGGCSDLKRHA